MTAYELKRIWRKWRAAGKVKPGGNSSGGGTRAARLRGLPSFRPRGAYGTGTYMLRNSRASSVSSR
jgi:hypothetical protein